MANPRKRRQDRSRVQLEVTGVEPGETAAAPEVRAAAVPWLAAALAGALLSVLAGWLIVTGPAVAAWLPSPATPLASALHLGTQGWLLAHGAGAVVDSSHITLAPLGLTLLIFVILSGVAGFAARQFLLTLPDDDIESGARRRIVGRIMLPFAAAYTLTVGLVSFLISDPGQTARALFGAALLSTAAGALGSARTVHWRPQDSWAGWARAIPRAVLTAQLVMVVGGVLALATALYQGRGRMADLTAALGPGTSGAVVLLLIQLAYVPNLILWAASWTLAAGFSVGDGSIISPTLTSLGILPSIPVFGALPGESIGRDVFLFWMLTGILAGASAATVVVRARRRARFDETALVGGLSGVLAGVTFTAFAALSSGSLGTGRLALLGPRLVQLVIMGSVLMGLAGMATGLALGVLRPPVPPVTAPEGRAEPDEGEPTRMTVRLPGEGR